MHLTEARKIAVEICYKMQPFCDVINIAGSVRRKKWEPKDLEIICVAKMVEFPNPDLFDNTPILKQAPQFAEIVLGLGEVIKGKPDGRYMQILLPQGVKLDLFMPMPNEYYRQFAIRTGSADYARQVLATAWRKKGWVGTENGLRLERECVGEKDSAGKIKWKCTRKEPTLAPAWRTEIEFFNWLGIEWVEPMHRNI